MPLLTLSLTEFHASHAGFASLAPTAWGEGLSISHGHWDLLGAGNWVPALPGPSLGPSGRADKGRVFWSRE